MYICIYIHHLHNITRFRIPFPHVHLQVFSYWTCIQKKISFEYIIRPLDNFIKLDMLKKQSEKFCKLDVSMAYLLKTRIQFSFEKYSRIG